MSRLCLFVMEHALTSLPEQALDARHKDEA
jgi:hypothetical protein